MKFRLLTALALCTVLALGAAAQTKADNVPWTNLFDGKTLNGWVKRGGDAPYHVEDKCIVGVTVPGKEVNGKMQRGTENTFLCTDRNFSDFILEVDFKVDPSMNSGVQIRSNSTKDFKDYRVHGYQVEIDPSSRAWTGGIYDEGDRGWLYPLKDKPEAQKAFKQNEWNHFRVEAIGDSIKTWLNGVPCADLKDDYCASGFIALQVHGSAEPESHEVRWRNIRIKDLSKKTKN